jgi:4'-phosphopantetheinyl transferase
MSAASTKLPPPRLPALWGAAPERIAPGAGEVVLVATNLDVDPGRLAALRATFSPREEDRFQSFATDALRSRWGAGRGTLREVLGRALRCAPQEVQFRYGPHGKPQAAGSPLRFNISHSGALAVIALALGAEVGVDVELPRVRRSDAIARRFYAPAEIERLFAEPDQGRRADAFFRLWTCKEAFLKATGEGLSRSTRSYEIALQPPRLVWATGIPDAGRYSVHPLDVGDPYRGALVAEMPRAALRHYRWG